MDQRREHFEKPRESYQATEQDLAINVRSCVERQTRALFTNRWLAGLLPGAAIVACWCAVTQYCLLRCQPAAPCCAVLSHTLPQRVSDRPSARAVVRAVYLLLLLLLLLCVCVWVPFASAESPTSASFFLPPK